ncbi:hypothetical protein RCL1_006595 [Eukaryota sp. TZLM3-RCL]
MFGLRDITNAKLRIKPGKPVTQVVTSQPVVAPPIVSKASYDIDLPPRPSDPLSVYAQDIYNYLREWEQRTHPHPRYLDKQPELNADTRAVVIDWMVEIHSRFQSVPESIFTAVNYLDRFLSQKVVVRQKLQLVAYACLFLACKFEDIYTPRLKHWLKIVSPQIMKADLLRAERLLCTTLDFAMAVPSAFTFLRRFTKIAGADTFVKYSAHFLIEYSLTESDILHHYPSAQAAAALIVCSELFNGNRESWPRDLEQYSGYSRHELEPAIAFMKRNLSESVKSHVYNGKPRSAIYKKYATEPYNYISLEVRKKLIV